MDKTSSGDELSDFIDGTIESIERSLKEKNYFLKTPIDFELAVVSVKKAGGKLNIVVADAGGSYEKEKISKMKFSIAQRPGAPVIASTSF